MSSRRQYQPNPALSSGGNVPSGAFAPGMGAGMPAQGNPVPQQGPAAQVPMQPVQTFQPNPQPNPYGMPPQPAPNANYQPPQPFGVNGAGLPAQVQPAAQPYQAPSAPAAQHFYGAAGQSPVAIVNPAHQCPREYLRLTVNVLPQTMDLATKSGLPLGAVIHPLAEVPGKEVPLVDFGSTGIVRCQKCRAYVSPFVRFVEGGRRWTCNICGLLNNVPADYFSPVGPDGNRLDIGSRVELQNGIVEFLAPSEYMFRPPQPPTYLFLIDVSYYAVSTGIVKLAAEMVKQCLDRLPGEGRTKVGVITFDSKLHFYDLSQSRPHMQVCCEVSDVFVPPGQEFLVNLSDNMDGVKNLLEKLPTMFTDTREVSSCLGTALGASFQVIKAIGGKIVLFTGLLPAESPASERLGPGRLQQRFDPKLLGTDKETTLLRPQSAFYKTFALECSRAQVSVDCHLFDTQKYIDVATIGQLSQLTGGTMYHYPEWNPVRDGEKFCRDIERNLTRTTGFEAVMRVRCSKGIRISSHYGNMFLRSSDLMALPNIDADKAFAVQMQLTENLSGAGPQYAYMQSALLYTTSGGERRIRVLNLAIPLTVQMMDLFNYADQEALINLLGKMAVEKSLDSKLSDAKEALVNKCTEILATYRVAAAGKMAAAAQLLLPESLKQLPLLALALSKSTLFNNITEIHPDVRASAMMLFRTLPVELGVKFLYPTLYRIYPLDGNAGLHQELEENEEVEDEDLDTPVILPSPLNLSSEKLDRRSAFLLDDGQQLILWIGKAVHHDEVAAIFGSANPQAFALAPNDDPDSTQTRIYNIVDGVRSQKPYWQRLTITMEGTTMDPKFFSHFIEDKQRNTLSYYEFLQLLQRNVSTKAAK